MLVNANYSLYVYKTREYNCQREGYNIIVSKTTSVTSDTRVKWDINCMVSSANGKYNDFCYYIIMFIVPD